MIGADRVLAGLGALALSVALSVGAHAAVVSATPNQALSAVPYVLDFAGGAASVAFTSASTGYGPGAAVATSGNALVTSFFGDVTDFFSGATIDQTGQLYSFSPFPAAAAIPFSAADDFIGLAYTANDGVHYGYAEVAGPNLVSFGFESTPGATILAGAQAVPEPATLILLVAGLAGVAAVRGRHHPAAPLS